MAIPMQELAPMIAKGSGDLLQLNGFSGELDWNKRMPQPEHLFFIPPPQMVTSFLHVYYVQAQPIIQISYVKHYGSDTRRSLGGIVLAMSPLLPITQSEKINMPLL